MIRALRCNGLKSASTYTLRQIAVLSYSTVSSSNVPVSSLVQSCHRHSLLRNRASSGFVRGYAQVVKVPEMAESITEGTLAKFMKEVGDYVEQDEEVASIETDKIDVAVNAPTAGTITELLAEPDDTVKVGQDLFKIEPGAPPEGHIKKEAPETKVSPEPAAAQKPAEKPAKKPVEDQASLSKEAPKAPVAPAYSEAPVSSSVRAEKPAAQPAQFGDSAMRKSFSREEHAVKMNRMRLRIAERLKEAQNTAASLTTFNECDMSAVMELRKRYKDEIIKRKGVKIGFMGLFAKACAVAMKEVPSANASIVDNSIVYHDYFDLSVAVATPKGLVTPVVRNVESMTVVEIEHEIAQLSVRARENKLTLEDLAGGTFTISNGGVFGSLYGTPIINMPQCAVLGMHGVKDRVVAINGKVEIRPMMYLALTYDHRILDGREAVTYLRIVKELIEDPAKMLLL